MSDEEILKKYKEQDIRQVIVVRRDLMNPLDDFVGKMIAQAGHGFVGGILNLMNVEKDENGNEVRTLKIENDSYLYLWLHGLFKKITVYVDSEEELLHVYNKAIKKGLNACLIKDAGLTCYNPDTYTCCSIGPAPKKKFNGITNHLSISFKKE